MSVKIYIICFVLINLVFSGASYAVTENCQQASFVFSKLAVAAIRCNFPQSDEILNSVSFFYDLAEDVCGTADLSKLPSSFAGVSLLDKEFEKLGQNAVCKRIYWELFEMSSSSRKSNNTKNYSIDDACRRFPNLCN